jgi:membrane-bound lytic murein transglycosylase F
MALAKKYGAIPQRWSDVRRYILLLQDPRYYNDPVVRSGYMRGSETAQYVDNIMQRHSQYRVALATGAKVKVPVPVPVDASTASPHRAAKKNKWRKD